jgi:hypothetical protein
MATYTFTISRRTVSCALAAFAALLVAALLVAGLKPAVAASTDGEIQIKGVGSTYVKNHSAGVAVDAGRTANYSIKVVNRGLSLAQFKIKAAHQYDPSTAKMFSGTTDVTSLTYSSDGFITGPIAPGDAVLLKLAVTLPGNADADNRSQEVVTLQSTANAYIGQVTSDTTRTAPANGTTAWDAFARAGYEPYVGGSAYSVAYAAPLKPGQTAVFTIRLKNDGTSPSTIGLHTHQSFPCASFTVQVKDGTADVTAAAQAGTYVTPTLAAGRYRDLKVRVTLGGGTPVCGFVRVDADALKGFKGAINVSQGLLVGVAAS